MDAQNKQTIIIDLRRNSTVQLPHFTQFDTNILEFNIKENGVNADLTNVTQVVANYKRKDGNITTRILTSANSVVTYQLGAEEMEVPGIAELSLSFFAGENRLSTAKLKLYMNSSLAPYFEGGDGLPLLQELFIEVAAAVEEINETNVSFNDHEADRQTQEALRQTAEGQRSSAETVRGNAESTRITNEQNRQTAEIGRTNAEASRVTAESTRSSNEQTRQTQEQARQTNTQNKINEMTTRMTELQGVDAAQFNTRLLKAEGELSQSSRQTQTLGQGVSILNAAVNTPVDVEVEGRTLVSLGNTPLEASKTYVLSAKRTKIKVGAGATTYQGVSKFTGETGLSQVTRIANFEDKVSASTLDNPHRSGWSMNTTLINPTVASNFSEWATGDYVNMSSLNGTSRVLTAAASGAIAQVPFSFSLIEEIERHIGTIPRSDVAGKVQWIKDNVQRVAGNWRGFGSSVGGSKATFTMWMTNTSTWAAGSAHTAASVAGLVASASSVSLPNVVDSAGFVHFIAYADASNGTIASIINTDYIDLEIELKAGVDFREPSLPLYEVNAADYAKILVDWNEDEVRRRYPAVKGVQHINGLAIIAEGENLLPPFYEWTTHANARVISPYELELNAAGLATNSGTNVSPFVKLVPGQTITISGELSPTARLNINRSGKDGTYLRTTAITTLPYSYTLAADEYSVNINFNNGPTTTGVLTLKNPMLTLGIVTKPFAPRNPSTLLAPTKLGAIGTAKDLLFKQDGVWKRRKAVEKDVVLDGNAGWVVASDHTGMKRFRMSLPVGFPVGNGIGRRLLTKYNGLVTKDVDGSGNVIDVSDSYGVDVGASQFVLGVSDIDTGYGETYTPIVDEIKAFFNGWKASTVDANGKPATWISVMDGSAAPTQTLAYVSANKAANHVPYKLSYILTTPVVETVNVEGDIIANGPTQIEVTAGAIVREKILPFSTATFTYVNTIAEGLPASNYLKNRPERILSVYKNGNLDSKWTINSSAANGKQRAFLLNVEYDPTAEYTASYLVFDRQLLTVNPLDVDTSFAQNVRSAVDDIVNRVGDLTTVSSVSVQSIAELYKRVKALGG